MSGKILQHPGIRWGVMSGALLALVYLLPGYPLYILSLAAIWAIAQAAVLRRAQSGAPFVPEEALTVEEALRAYTIGAAYAAFAESELGMLAPGQWADLVVLGEDPVEADPECLAEIPVLVTVVGGTVVYER